MQRRRWPAVPPLRRIGPERRRAGAARRGAAEVLHAARDRAGDAERRRVRGRAGDWRGGAGVHSPQRGRRRAPAIQVLRRPPRRFSGGQDAREVIQRVRSICQKEFKQCTQCEADTWSQSWSGISLLCNDRGGLRFLPLPTISPHSKPKFCIKLAVIIYTFQL